MGPDDVPGALRVLREIGSGLSYLHDLGAAHGCMSPETVFASPMGRLWMMGWQWAMPMSEIPTGISPDFRFMPVPHEWTDGVWCPTPASDQWQLAATCFAALTGENAAARRSAADPAHASRLSARARRHHRSRAERGSRETISVHRGVASLDRSAHRRTHDGRARRRRTGDVDAPTSRPRRGSAGRSPTTTRCSRRSAPARSVRCGACATSRSAARSRSSCCIRTSRATNASSGRFRREAQLAAQLAHPAIVPDLRLGQPRRRRLVHDGARRGRIGRGPRRAIRAAHAQRDRAAGRLHPQRPRARRTRSASSTATSSRRTS